MRVLISYPEECLSRNCGKTDCNDCLIKPKLNRFKKVRDKYGFEQVDKIWCPTLYEAEVDKPEADIKEFAINP